MCYHTFRNVYRSPINIKSYKNYIIVLGPQNKQITPNHLQRLTPKAVGPTKTIVSKILYNLIKISNYPIDYI